MKREPPPIKFVAEVSPVNEVTLHGTADLSFWQDRLRPEKLTPLAENGRAQLFVSGTETRYLGIQFRECILGIHVAPQRQQAQDVPTMYLLHAWNSLRAFAWIERNLFSTPYYPGRIKVEPQLPALLTVTDRDQVLISASQMTASPPQETADEAWFGAIMLPPRGRGGQKFFFGRLSGQTERWDFVQGADRFALLRSDSCPTIGWLQESHFTPHTWALRRTAKHAKSKTYRAADFFTPYE